MDDSVLTKVNLKEIDSEKVSIDITVKDFGIGINLLDQKNQIYSSLILSLQMPTARR